MRFRGVDPSALYDRSNEAAYRQRVEQAFLQVASLADLNALPAYAVADLPDASVKDGMLIFVSDESGGAQPAFSLAGAWRRFSDRAVVS